MTPHDRENSPLRTWTEAAARELRAAADELHAAADRLEPVDGLLEDVDGPRSDPDVEHAALVSAIVMSVLRLRGRAAEIEGSIAAIHGILDARREGRTP